MLLITPQTVKARTSFEVVKERPDVLLQDDILMAQMKLFQTCGHRFEDYETLPPEVELALIKLTELYALANSNQAWVQGLTSEKIGDYHYTMMGTSEARTVSLLPLIRDHIREGGQSGTTVQLRFL